MREIELGDVRSLGRVVGVEHEYRVAEAGSHVDFRTIIHDLSIPGRRIDPGDTHAYRTRSGLKITCDGPDAEIATPPLSLSAGLVQRLTDWTIHGSQQLAMILGRQFDIEGVSTHISVSVDNDLVVKAAGLFSRTFSPALMLLMDATSSPGLLIRPRRERLEFGAEFVTGKSLAAASLLAAGGAIVSERAAGGFLARWKLAPAVRVDVVRAVDRYGWYVARDAFGVDLYAKGRSTLLKREFVGTISAQQCLEEAWAAARDALSGFVSDDDVRVADDVVAGRTGLPMEVGFVSRPPTSVDAVQAVPLGDAMTDIRTPEHTLSAVAATWEFVVFATQGKHPLHVSVPVSMLDVFLAEAVQGRWDRWISSAADSVDGSGILSTFHEASAFGVWRDFEYSPGLAPPERGADGVERLAIQ